MKMLKIVGNGRENNMASRSVAYAEEAFESIEVIDDLSSWEFINPSDEDDSDDNYSYDEADLDDDNDNVSDPPGLIGSPSSDVSMSSLPNNLASDLDFVHGHGNDAVVRGKLNVEVYDDAEEEDDGYGYEDEDDDEDDYDFDDELVPNWASDRFGKQRLRKLDKKGCSNSKRIKSKTVPCYFYNGPGSVRGTSRRGLASV